MLGAIIGDIVGSRFEWDNNKSKEFSLFTPNCFFTDDSVMSIAIGKALMDCQGDYQKLSARAIEQMRYFGNLYPDVGYGGNFFRWLFTSKPEPYGSYGNGAAMRIGPVGLIARTEEEAISLSEKVTAITHNHPEGMKGAEAIARLMVLAKKKTSIEVMRAFIKAHYYALNFTLDQIRDNYTFDETCQGTVPQAIVAFFESYSFEDAIRNAISIGGDSDTLGAITGNLAEAYYGIPDDLKIQALEYLDWELVQVVNDFYEFLKTKND
ncbi:MAG: ADP-ribosylglycohydrolase family protein [Bacilli bacterium]